MPHGHVHADGRSSRDRLAAVLGVTAVILVLQVIGGYVTGSLALLADAGHVFTDLLAVASILAAVIIGARPASQARTFGSARWEVIVAAANACLLLLVAGLILTEAWSRWQEPGAVLPGPMIVIAVLGLLGNAVALRILHHADGDSVAVRAARLEVLGDLAGSIGVVAAGVVIATTGWTGADILVSVAIAIFIVPRALRLLRETSSVLLESTPGHLDLDEVRRHLAGAEGVRDVHDLHAWSITRGRDMLTAHVVVDPRFEPATVLRDLQACVRTDFGIDHSTFQVEPAGPCLSGAHP